MPNKPKNINPLASERVVKGSACSSISNNNLNLPKTAVRTGVSISYGCDALSTKLQKYSNVNGIETARDYVSGIEYKKEGDDPQQIDLILAGEGYLQDSYGTYVFHHNDGSSGQCTSCDQEGFFGDEFYDRTETGLLCFW